MGKAGSCWCEQFQFGRNELLLFSSGLFTASFTTMEYLAQYSVTFSSSSVTVNPALPVIGAAQQERSRR